MSQQVDRAAGPVDDGRHDFDFLFGEWRIANRRIENPTADEPRRWIEFESTMISRPILGGLGNCDTYSAPDYPGRPGFQGFVLRLFDPGAGLWRIWWASTSGGGRLDTPVVGRFGDGIGRFECDDVIEGQALRVRYEWKDISTRAARWEQSFSLDGGRTFHLNYIMEFTRVT